MINTLKNNLTQKQENYDVCLKFFKKFLLLTV